MTQEETSKKAIEFLSENFINKDMFNCNTALHNLRIDRLNEYAKQIAEELIQEAMDHMYCQVCLASEIWEVDLLFSYSLYRSAPSVEYMDYYYVRIKILTKVCAYLNKEEEKDEKK